MSEFFQAMGSNTMTKKQFNQCAEKILARIKSLSMSLEMLIDLAIKKKEIGSSRHLKIAVESLREAIWNFKKFLEEKL